MSAPNKKKAFFILFLIVATELIGFGLIIPILPQIAIQFQVPTYMIGFLLAAYSMAQFVAAPILGGLSDRFGRKRIFIISKIGTCIAYIILAFAGNYWLFLISRLLDGFTGGNISTARAYVADITTPEERPKGMAIIGISFGVGFLLGPALGGFLYGSQYGFMLPALVAGSLSLLALILTIFLFEDVRKPTNTAGGFGLSPEKFKLLLKSPTLLFLCAIQLLYMTIFSGFETTFSVFTFKTFNYSEIQNSWLFVYLGVLALFIQGGIVRKVSRFIRQVTVGGFMLAGLGFLALSVTTESGLLPVLAVFSIGIGFLNAYLPSLASNNAPEADQGKLMGVYESMGSLGRIIGPNIAYMTFIPSISFLYIVYGSIMVALTALFVAFVPKSNAN